MSDSETLTVSQIAENIGATSRHVRRLIMSDSFPFEWKIGPRRTKVVAVTPDLSRWMEDYSRRKKGVVTTGEASEREAATVEIIRLLDELELVRSIQTAPQAGISDLSDRRLKLQIKIGEKLNDLRSKFQRGDGWTKLFLPGGKEALRTYKIPITRHVAQWYIGLAKAGLKVTSQGLRRKAGALQPHRREHGDGRSHGPSRNLNLLAIDIRNQIQIGKLSEREIADIKSIAADIVSACDAGTRGFERSNSETNLRGE